MLRHINLTIYLCLCTFLASYAQQGRIHGKITDQQQQALPGAIVLLRSAKDSAILKTTLTNAEGVFAFESILKGEYLLQVSYIMYHPYWSRITGPQTSPVTVQLRPLSGKLKGVTVKGYKPVISASPGKTVMNVEKSVVAQNKSIFELLKDLPGVTVSKDGEISIKGKSGVTVMLDGEPVNLSAAQLKTLLKATPATTVKTIEVMDNPPASMDAAGNAGVINITLSRRISPGFNGTFTTGLGWGRYMKTDQSIYLNYGGRKWSFTASYAYSFDRSWWQDSLNRTLQYRDKPQALEQIQHIPEKINGHLLKLGIDRRIDSNRVLSLQLGFDRNRSPYNGYAYTRFFSHPPLVDSMLTQTNTALNEQRAFNATLQYKWTISQRDRFNASFHTDQMKINGEDAFYVTTPNSLRQNRNGYPGTMQVYSLKADYSHELKYMGTSIGKLEAGFKSTLARIRYTRWAETYTQGWVHDPANSNRFRFREHINALYAQTDMHAGKWDLRLGLRAEQTDNRGDSSTANPLVTQSYLSLFPNASVGYQLYDDWKLSLSYNRRIERPDYQTLNPAIRYLDPLTLETGNPSLRPQYADNIELGQTFFKTAQLSLGYSRVRNAMLYNVQQEPGSLIAKYTTLNAPPRNNFYGSLAFPLPLPKWWQNYNVLFANMTKYNGQLEGQDYREKLVSLGFSSNNSISLPAKFTLEVNGWYDGGGLYGTLRYKPLGELSVGFSKQLLNERLTLGCSVSDVFRTTRYISTETSARDGSYFSYSRGETRIFKMSLTWRFGRGQGGKQEEDSADEENRLSGKKGMRR